MGRISDYSLLAFALVGVIGASTSALPCMAQNIAGTGVSIKTWQQDSPPIPNCTDCAYRTGQNLAETALVSPISDSNFGQLCSVALQGQVYSQPLVVTKVRITYNGQAHTFNSVAYVVTENDYLYAINADPTDTFAAPCAILSGAGLGTKLLAPGQTSATCNNVGGGGCATIAPNVGVVGTPAINIDSANNTGTIYLVAQTQDSSNNVYHYLHAVSITAFTDVSVLICPPALVCPSSTSNLWSAQHVQRPGLLYANGYIYAAFSMMDGILPPFPNGAIFGYNVSNLSSTPLYFQTSIGSGSQTSNGAGIWQDGAGLAYGQDSKFNEYIYLNTGNGNWDGISSWGDSLLKLQPSVANLNFTVAGSFTPIDQYYRSTKSCGGTMAGDIDYGSGGVLLIPDKELQNSNWSYLAVSGEKEGGLWFTDRTTPGGHLTACDPTQTVPGNCQCTSANGYTDTNVIQSFWPGTPNASPLIHTSPAYWEKSPEIQNRGDFLYLASQYSSKVTNSGQLVQWELCDTGVGPICGTSGVAAFDATGPVSFLNGATPTISANSTTATDAIVWVTWSDGSVEASNTGGMNGVPAVNGQLYAFDAVTMSKMYGSNDCKLISGALPDHISPATKFSVPTVANGYVYLGTQGPLCNGTCNYNTGTFYIFGLNPPARSCVQ